MKGELAQTTEGRRKDPGPDVEETEVQDVCARCKETKGLCGCIIFEDDRVVLSVTKFEKPYIVPMRFQKFHGKELPWQIMKSKQALFASELKSCKTDFARDNRIAFEFTLPIYTGKDPHEIGDIDVNEFDIDDSCAFEGEFSLPLKLNYTNINDDISSFSASNFLNNNQFDSISTSSSDTPCKCADIEQEGLVEDCDRKVWLDGTLQCGKHASISFEWMKCEGDANIPSSVRLDSIVPCDSPDNCDFPSFDTSLCDAYIDGQPPNLKVEVNSNTNDVVVESKSLNVATDTNKIVSGSINNQKTSTSDENRLSAKCFANAQQLGQENSLSSFSNLSTDTVVRDTTDETLVSVINGDDGHDDNIPAKVRENTVLSNCKVAHLKGANLGHDEEADEIKDVDKPTEAEPEDSDYTSNSVDVLDEYLISICDTENELQTDVGLANILKRKVTRTEDDNRIIVLHELKENEGREPESEVISNIKENANCSGEEENAENENTTITGNSAIETHVSPAETWFDMFNVASESIDFSLPPSEFRRRLHERFEMFPFKRPDSSTSRILGRGEGEMSEFARSLYESVENGLEPEEDRSSTSSSPIPSIVSSGRSSPFGTETGVDVTFPSSHCETLEMEDLLGAVGGRAEKGKISDIENEQQSSEVNDLVPDLPDHWTGYMQEQLLKCKKVEGLPRSFRATVFCVDASRHVSSTEWSHVCRSLKTFLEYVGWVRREFGIEEYVALVITGTETSVTVHLTTDLKRVEAALDTVKPGGECFMLPALALSMYCLAPFQGRSFPQVHDVIMENRIIVISAGHVSHWSHSMPVDGGTGQNVTDTASAIQEITDSIRKWPWKAIKVQLHLVPGVGQVDMVFFEEIGSVPLPETKVVVHESHGGSLDMEQLARSTYNHYITGQITCQMFRASEAFQRDVFCNLVQTLFPDRTHRDLASMCEIAETAHAEYVAQKNEPESGDSWRLERKELPLLGSRVTVGPDMDESTKACVAGRGTVVGHLKSGGQVSVCWDNGYQNECCFNPKGKYEALPDDSPVNGRGHDVIRPGFTVRRGPDWAYGEQDGGPDQVGHVLHVSRDRSVLVRWPNGRLQNYRYNCGGLYDVVISDADDPLGMEAYTTKMNKRNMQRCTAQPDLCLTVAAGGRD
ncbi:uncharacterized protein LOC128227736 isoform X2 [Mya arenaria]|uniref:uncharacterized protein LOC128227736 isoform X2 n=1 Tax=Mya arenaria TaxID=6604 RepID=UPI0022E97D1B|nr:uncharacterized protein LOC128227736 isoform X2 [Mya arenaria]